MFPYFWVAAWKFKFKASHFCMYWGFGNMCQIDGVMLALWGFGGNMHHCSVLVILLAYSFTCTYSMWQIGKISVRAPSANRTQGQRAPPGLNRQLLVNHNSMHRILILRWNASPIALGEKKWMHSLTDLSRCLLHRSLALAHSSLQEQKKSAWQ